MFSTRKSHLLLPGDALSLHSHRHHKVPELSSSTDWPPDQSQRGPRPPTDLPQTSHGPHTSAPKNLCAPAPVFALRLHSRATVASVACLRLQRQSGAKQQQQLLACGGGVCRSYL
uniref:Uncharacterized protein n=1 Tax=Knipowitschia caucasica TaxID=637954 RepID=A0AAV2M482_KNICA